MAIERAYGVLKRRFPLLKNGLRFRKVLDSANLVVAAVCIHNFCIDQGDFQDEENEEVTIHETLHNHEQDNDDEDGEMVRNNILYSFL